MHLSCFFLILDRPIYVTFNFSMWNMEKKLKTKNTNFISYHYYYGGCTFRSHTSETHIIIIVVWFSIASLATNVRRRKKFHKIYTLNGWWKCDSARDQRYSQKSCRKIMYGNLNELNHRTVCSVFAAGKLVLVGAETSGKMKMKRIQLWNTELSIVTWLLEIYHGNSIGQWQPAISHILK